MGSIPTRAQNAPSFSSGHCAAKIRDASVLRLALSIVDRGAANGRRNGNAFLQWHGQLRPGWWLGQSQGSAGVLQQLLAVPELVANTTAAALLRATLDHTCAAQFPSGNFPTEGTVGLPCFENVCASSVSFYLPGIMQNAPPAVLNDEILKHKWS